MSVCLSFGTALLPHVGQEWISWSRGRSGSIRVIKDGRWDCCFRPLPTIFIIWICCCHDKTHTFQWFTHISHFVKLQRVNQPWEHRKWKLFQVSEIYLLSRSISDVGGAMAAPAISVSHKQYLTTTLMLVSITRLTPGINILDSITSVIIYWQNIGKWNRKTEMRNQEMSQRVLTPLLLLSVILLLLIWFAFCWETWKSTWRSTSFVPLFTFPKTQFNKTTLISADHSEYKWGMLDPAKHSV